MKNIKNMSNKELITLFIIFTSAILALVLNTSQEILDGFRYILDSQFALVDDYIKEANTGAALMNASLVTLLFYVLLKTTNQKVGDLQFAALIILFGFGVLGKNIFTALPIITGSFVVDRVYKDKPGSSLTLAMMVMALSPVIQFIWNYFPAEYGFNKYAMYAIGFVLGAGMSYATIVIAWSMSKVHKGLTLYNIGFTSGVIAMIINAGFRMFAVDTSAAHQAINTVVSIDKDIIMYWILSVAVFALALGLFRGKDYLGKLFKLWTDKEVTNSYTEKADDNAVALNIGTLILVGVGLCLIYGSDFEAISFAAIFAFAGFGAYGKNPFNTFPIIAGMLIGYYIMGATGLSMDTPTLMGRLMFGAALAPVVMHYGWKFGIIAGLIQMAIANQVFDLHTFTLYHNGFATGLTAIVMFGIGNMFCKQLKK